jgi:ribosome-binding factor A
MPEHRARKHHQDRVAETLRLEIGTMVEGELSDPRIGNCYVSEVSLNPGGKSARVYVAVDAPKDEAERAESDTIAGLEAAKGYIRHELKERMGVRHIPDLVFLADRSGRLQARIEELMARTGRSSAAGRSAGLGSSAAVNQPASAGRSAPTDKPQRAPVAERPHLD